MLANHFFENVPNDRLLPLDHFARLLDRGGVLLLLKLVVDEWLEQLERHLLRQTALMQFQLRTDDDHRTSRVIDALAEQVLTKTSLLALQSSRQRLQRTIVHAAQHAAATAVVEQRIDGFLKHALFVAHDDFRRAQLHQLLQTVVAVDDATIQIVQDPKSRNVRHRAAPADEAQAESPESHRGSSTPGDCPTCRNEVATFRRLEYFSFFCCEVSSRIRRRSSTDQFVDVDHRRAVL